MFFKPVFQLWGLCGGKPVMLCMEISFFYWVHICFPLSAILWSFFCPLKFHRQVIKPEYARTRENFGLCIHSRWAAAPTHTHTALLTMLPPGLIYAPGQLFPLSRPAHCYFNMSTKVNACRLTLFLLLLLPLGLCISRSECDLWMDSGLWFYFLLFNIHPRFPGWYSSSHML